LQLLYMPHRGGGTKSRYLSQASVSFTGGTISCTTDPTGALVPTLAGTTPVQPPPAPQYPV